MWTAWLATLCLLQVEVDTTITGARTPEARRVEVAVEVRGLDVEAGAPTMEWDDWGEWSSHDSLALRYVEATPPVDWEASTATSWTFAVPDEWDGAVQVRYHVAMTRHGSSAHQRIGLLPWWKDDYANGFSCNTCASWSQADQPLEARHRFRVQVEEGDVCANGWGAAVGTWVEDDPGEGNTTFVFGRPTSCAEGRSIGDVTVSQFGAGRAVASEAQPVVRALFEWYSERLGPSGGAPPHVLLLDTGGGGVRVDGAIVVGYASDDIERVLAPGMLHTLAHELLHDWIGGPPLSLSDTRWVWFKEGFTDYLSLRALAELQLITPERFVERLVELERAARQSAWGTVAFADPTVSWRDGDGPLEMMAYRAAAVLAFHLDVALRDEGGVSSLVRALIDDERTTELRHVRSWLAARDLGAFYDAFVASTEKPDFAKALTSVGVGRTRVAAPLTWAGLATDTDGHFGRVVDVAADSPAAKAGVRVGDVVRGFWPARGDAVIAPDDLYPEHRYGLVTFEPGQLIHFGVERDGEGRELELHPDVVEGGWREAWSVVDAPRMHAFLNPNRR